jgi:hypothetical protein
MKARNDESGKRRLQGRVSGNNDSPKDLVLNPPLQYSELITPLQLLERGIKWVMEYRTNKIPAIPGGKHE